MIGSRSPALQLNNPGTPSGIGVVHQEEPPGFVVARIRFDVVEVERSPLLRGYFLASLPEIGLLAAMLSVAALVSWSGFGAV